MSSTLYGSPFSSINLIASSLGRENLSILMFSFTIFFISFSISASSSAENAVALSKTSGYSFKIVTLEGDVLTPSGSMSGGSKKNQDSSLIGKENEIKKIEANIKKNQAYLTTLENDYNKYQTKTKFLARLRITLT